MAILDQSFQSLSIIERQSSQSLARYITNKAAEIPKHNQRRKKKTRAQVNRNSKASLSSTTRS
jgi:hypothetical protein